MSFPEPASEDPTLVPNDVEAGQTDAVVVPPQRSSPQQLPASVPSLERLLSEAVSDIPSSHTPTETPPPSDPPPAATQDAVADATDEESIVAATEPMELPPLRRSRVWDVPFDVVTLSQATERINDMIELGRPSYVVTANLNYAMLHSDRPEMRPVTETADLILADGQPIVWRSRLTSTPLPTRVAGSELIFELAELSARKGWGIYFLGGETGVAATCAERLSDRYPGMVVAGVESPPFRQLSEEEQAQQDERIRRSNAKILLVAFGQPKGEQWIFENYKRLGIPVSIQLGASFDFIAGTAKRAPAIWQKVGMEWVYRMLSDPRRLVPRYASNAAFLARALVEDWKRLVTSWGMGDWTQESTKPGYDPRQD